MNKNLSKKKETLILFSMEKNFGYKAHIPETKFFCADLTLIMKHLKKTEGIYKKTGDCKM